MLTKRLMVTWLITGASLHAHAESVCKNGAPIEQKNIVMKPYTVTIFKDIQLQQNKSNKNYSLYIDGGKNGGCILFSKEAVLPSGEYTSEGAYGVYTSCTEKSDVNNGKLAYAFTKFDSIMGKDILRIQCYKMKTAAQLEKDAALVAAGLPLASDRFAPESTSAKYILESRSSKLRVRITTNE